MVRVLYGLKLSGVAFRAFLAERSDEMGFKHIVVYPDVWYRDSTKSEFEEYY